MLREKRPIRSYHGEVFRTNRTNKKHLSADFGHRCAYCDDLDEYGGGYRAYHVEHFAPKEKFPELRYDYDNLLMLVHGVTGQNGIYGQVIILK